MRLNFASLFHSLKFLPVSLAAWGLAFGLFVLLRTVGVESTFREDPSDQLTVLFWLACSALFGTTFWLIAVVTETRVFRSRSYGLIILVGALAMLISLVLYLVARGFIMAAVTDLTLVESWHNTLIVLRQPVAVLFLAYVFIVAAALSFVRQMEIMLGSRVLLNLLLGKYHHPKTETRIFMFVDLEGSTTYAEQLGHQKFCRLIQECFRDLTDSAIRYNVEIYQYVGDEAILTWHPTQGLQDCNCLRTFFAFEQALADRASFYREQFGIQPKFKAGANMGEVTVAEVGVLKRDIAYLSDVLNTAARLEAMCAEHGARLLITETLKDALPEVDELQYAQVGELTLRGKSQLVNVYRVDCRTDGSIAGLSPLRIPKKPMHAE